MLHPRAVLLSVLVAASTFMTLAAAVSGWVQVRKAQVAQANKLEWKDSVAHTALGLERQFLQLRGRLAVAIATPRDAAAQDDLALRWEVFVSRARLLSTTQGLDKLGDSEAFQQLQVQLATIIGQGDRILAQRPLVLQDARMLLAALDEAAFNVQSTTRAAASLTADTIDEQFGALQDQAILIGGLAALQLLLLVLVGLSLRGWQKQQLEARTRLEQLAEELGEAKHAAETGARAKSQFLANMSHELRTPFQGVLGMLQLLGQTPLSASQRELVQTARGSATHLLSILNEILDLSAIEAGKAILHAVPLELHRLCREVEDLMGPQAAERGLVLDVHIDGPQPTWVLGDATRIKQILFNLINNAIKFTPKGEVRLNVRCQPRGDGRLDLTLQVTDTGVGMDAKTLGALFQRFAPGDASLTRRFGGTGLGLEISRNLARLMGGDLQARSEPGRGSCFELTLLLQQAAPQEEPLPAAVASQPRSLRVLVADDHPINRRYMGLVLEGLRHRATFCENGRQALEAVGVEQFDAVLMDIHMPEMDGLEATRAIRALGGEYLRLPILALSADVMAGSRERALAAGCNGFLAKPLQIEGLQAALGLVDGRDVPESEPHGTLDESGCLSPRFNEMAARLPQERMRELLEMFFADESGTLESLREALKTVDVAWVLPSAHKCKGSARLLGLQAVADAAEHAEAWARGPDPAGAGALRLVRAFDDALDATRRALVPWLEPEPQRQA